MGAMLHPDTYGQELAQLIADLQRQSGALQKYGHDLERIETRKKVNAMRGMMNKMEVDMQKMIRMQYRQLKMQKDNKTQLEVVGKAINGNSTADMTEIEELKRVRTDLKCMVIEFKELKYMMEQQLRVYRANAVQNLFVLMSQDLSRARIQGSDDRSHSRQ